MLEVSSNFTTTNSFNVDIMEVKITLQTLADHYDPLQ